MLILLVFAGALMLARMSGFKFKLQKLFTPLVTTEAVSDPRPNTYLAKLFHKPRYDRLTTLVSEFAGREIGTFIDVGCGKGILQKWLKQNGVHVARYIGCDINADDLHENKSMERILCDVQHLPFKPQVAEAVTCSEVLEHVPEPYAGFNEILGISQHWVFLSFPNEKLKNALGFRYSEHISDLSEIELVRLAKEKNLTLFKREKLFFVFPPSVFDKLKLSYTAFYRPLVESVFHQLSIILGGFSLITTALLVFERQETG
jgi:ubiquinone/menaquinone biosynthesis C-methylase UbiE